MTCSASGYQAQLYAALAARSFSFEGEMEKQTYYENELETISHIIYKLYPFLQHHSQYLVGDTFFSICQQIDQDQDTYKQFLDPNDFGHIKT